MRVIPRVLAVLALATVLLMVKEWAYVATFRLYLDHRVDDAARSTARQRFDLDQNGVVPRIVMRDERVSFRAGIGQDATIRADVTAAGTGSYEIRVRRDGTDTLLASGPVAGTMSIACPFPTGNGRVDIVSHGELTWSDLRFQRSLILWPELKLLGILFLIALAWRYAVTYRRGPEVAARARLAWMTTATLVATAVIVLLAVEGSLRAAARHLPAGMRALRRDLGEPTGDPRWQLTPRYGQRLAANVGGAPNEWRDGDIVRMGFLPPAISERRVHRYAFQTDGEGFRNAATRDPIDVAALGDSFTDGLTVGADAAWPAQLEARLGVVVQNYGTAGFGPQQERLVLEDFALTHRPRVVVLAFFAGNDIRDAERFDDFERGDRTFTQPAIGWPLKDIFIRADAWYLTSLVRAAVANSAPRAQAKDDTGDTPSSPSVTPALPQFDRGLFTVPVNGHTLRFAFMPPYLNLLNYSEEDIAARRGWALALENIRRMQRMSDAAGARFVLMFIPFKSQVYLPLLERSFAGNDLTKALHVSLAEMMSRPPDIAAFSRNRLAQNALMRRFAAAEGIPFLDLTPALEERVARGENVYFPDDSHLNDAGQALTAETLAGFLRQNDLVQPRPATAPRAR